MGSSKHKHHEKEKSMKKRHHHNEEQSEKHHKRKRTEVRVDDEDMWVEKNIDTDTKVSSDAVMAPPDVPSTSSLKREEWMLGPSSAAAESSDFFSSLGVETQRKAKDKQKEKAQEVDRAMEIEKSLEIQDEQNIDPSTASDSAPKRPFTPGGPGSQWRMTRLKRVYETAEEEARDVLEVALERFDSAEAWELAQEERRILDERDGRRGRPQDRFESGDRGGGGEKGFMFSGSSSRSSSFRRPGGSGPSTPSAGGPPVNRRLDSLRLPSQASSPLQQSHTPIPSVLTPPPSQSSTRRALSPSSLNKLQAKVLRAKLVGAPNAEKLEREYEDAQRVANGFDDSSPRTSSKQNVKVEVLPTLDGRGRLYDIGSGANGKDEEGDPARAGNRRKKEKHFDTHDPRTGEIVRYNADDDSTTLTEMLRQERFGGGMADQKDQDMVLARAIVGDGKFENDLDYIDDNAAKLGRQKMRSDAMKRQFAIHDYKRTQKALADCDFCFSGSGSGKSFSISFYPLPGPISFSLPSTKNSFMSSFLLRLFSFNYFISLPSILTLSPLPTGPDADELPPRAPMIALGTRVYLSCTIHEELVPGHCLIVPIQHCLTMLEGDDDVWDEVKNFMKTLMRMFSEQEPQKGVLFYETVTPRSMKGQRHSYIECVPVEWEVWEVLGGYFKESILSSGSEWSTHRKLIDFAARPGGFRRSMVPNLPYFMVQFDYKGEKGYGHVIESDGGGAGRNGGKSKVGHGLGDDEEMDDVLGMEGTGEKGGGEFPRYFAAEIIGNVLGLEPRKWRRPRKVLGGVRDKERVKEFRAMYDRYDWTGMIGKE
ncbi:CwfJ C-terminus 1-domain-containing protein-like protein [Lentinula edodes]|uniref:CwfJ C-terminus 1-domain-containing protein-like protein n=1 Tax=Lentinula lateritia TaxID=40482 RepID=A0A9W8ZR83_9AGAR|nr:CwfJ C-terminus 1-domain-containing protein-like protein [Lentinula edodes]